MILMRSLAAELLKRMNFMMKFRMMFDDDEKNVQRQAFAGLLEQAVLSL
jgi:hypothetical protein